MPEPAGSHYYAVTLSFAMALFFFLSGLFVDRSLGRGPASYLRGKWWGILYPYLLWSVVLVVARWAMRGHINTPMGFDRLATIAWDPVQPMWFLYALFFCFVLYAVLRRLPWWLHLLVAVVLNVGQSGLSAGVLNDCLAHYLFFYLGALSAVWVCQAAASIRAGHVAALLVVYGVAVTHYTLSIVTPETWGAHPVVGTTPQWVHVPLLGIAAALGVCALLEKNGWMPWLATLGRFSLAIYMAHLLATAATRIILQQFFGLEDVMVHVALGTVAGVAFPATLYKLSERYGIQRWVGFGAA